MAVEGIVRMCGRSMMSGSELYLPDDAEKLFKMSVKK